MIDGETPDYPYLPYCPLDLRLHVGTTNEFTCTILTYSLYPVRLNCRVVNVSFHTQESGVRSQEPGVENRIDKQSRQSSIHHPSILLGTRPSNLLTRAERRSEQTSGVDFFTAHVSVPVSVSVSPNTRSAPSILSHQAANMTCTDAATPPNVAISERNSSRPDSE